MQRIVPNGNKLLVRPTKEDRESSGGIITNLEEDDVKSEGVVVEEGTTSFKRGDVVIYGKFAGDVIMIEGVQHRIMRDIEVLATIKEVQRGKEKEVK